MTSPIISDNDTGRSFHSRRSVLSLTTSTVPAPVQFDALRVSDEHLKDIKNKRVREFYTHQNSMIDRFMEVDEIVDSLQFGTPAPNSPAQQPLQRYGSMQHDEENQLMIHGHHTKDDDPTKPLLDAKPVVNKDTAPSWLVHLAINLSFLANVVLFGTKIFLALFTGSMAILASAFESFLDLLSNAIIFFTIRIIRQKDYYAYPVGKSRMEPLGIIVFAVIITTSFSQVLITSIQRLLDPAQGVEELDLSPLGLGLLIANIVIKGILWIWCTTIKGSSSVQALAQDHENDVVFNVASTIFPVVAVWAKWSWLDPVGAILLSIYIIYEWMVVLLENIRRLTGQAASTDDIKQLTYMAYRFSGKITAVDTVRAYYIGDRLLVEVDIVLPPDCPLREAHDVGEALQDALELMDNVERAFVHLDYNPIHAIEHRRVVEGVGFGQ